MSIRQAYQNLIEGVQYAIVPKGTARQGGFVEGEIHIRTDSKPLKGMMLEVSLEQFWYQNKEVVVTQLLETSCTMEAQQTKAWPFALKVPDNARLTVEPPKQFEIYKAQGWMIKLRLRRPFPGLDLYLEEAVKVEVAAEIDALIKFCKRRLNMTISQEPVWNEDTKQVDFRMTPPPSLAYALSTLDFRVMLTEDGLDGMITYNFSNKKVTDYLKTAIGKRKRIQQNLFLPHDALLLPDGALNFPGAETYLGEDKMRALCEGRYDGKLSLSDHDALNQGKPNTDRGLPE
ncbi:MAG: hypothetical protein QNK37_02520 [Acidobacteriota bacterium]|nr:hypothetical protein [Acidobacteriota bacterium]